MTVSQDIGAVSTAESWSSIDWKLAEKEVMKLQVRIAKATKQGRWNKVKSLQWLLTHSFYAKCLAVRTVTTNRGKNTPGIDGVVLKKSSHKYQMVQQMNRRTYRPQALRRIHIPKTNGKSRPLGIPVMFDRAWQALHGQALLPVAETTADNYSYGFRPQRSTTDAIERIFSCTSRHFDPKWVLEGDIKGCFDNISHHWILEHVTTDKRTLEKWLKSGFMEKGKFFPTDSGTPQGGVISPYLSNITLDGMEALLDREFGSSRNICGRVPYQAQKLVRKNGVKLCRFADDFIITGTSKELLRDQVKPLIEKFMKERGLELSQDKTKITPLNQGFDFLGQNVRKYDLHNGKSKLLIKPSKKSIQNFLSKVRQMIKAMATWKQENVIARLNPVIRGWVNYHRHVVSKKVFSQVDYEIWNALWRWAKRRHPNKGEKWISRRYFRPINGTQRAFSCPQKDQKAAILFMASSVPIVRHPQIKPETNPFDPDHEAYYEIRLSKKMHKNFAGRVTLKNLWTNQKGKCMECGKALPSQGPKGYIKYIQSRLKAGKANFQNLVLLHKECHTEGYNSGFNYELPVEVRNTST